MRPSEEAVIFIGVQSEKGQIYDVCVAGMLQAMKRWSGRVRIDSLKHMGICNSRDEMLLKFLDSGCTHFLSIDSDIGWTPEQAEMLIDMNVDLALGVYCYKNADAEPVIKPLPTKKPSAPWTIESSGAGFQVIKRGLVVRLFDEYRDIAYKTCEKGGLTRALNMQFFHRGVLQGEDTAFHCRVRDIGTQVWAHPGVVVGHTDGNTIFYPKW
jgi:hypothetical protein